MQSLTVILYKGKKSDNTTESAVISFTADEVIVRPDMQEILFLNKDGSVGAEFTTRSGAKLRRVGP